MRGRTQTSGILAVTMITVTALAVKVTAHHLTVAAWNYTTRRWDWWHRKRISQSPSPR